MNPVASIWYGVDSLAEKYSNICGYNYTLGNPIKFIDPDGTSTWVVKNGDKSYKVIGGNLNDKDVNIYEYTKDKYGKYTIRGKSIGVTPELISFYNSDYNHHKGKWAVGSIIRTDDNSGYQFINTIKKDDISLEYYIYNARNFHKFDFKSTNGSDNVVSKDEDFYYRGMPIGKIGNKTIYASARDIGNMMAGYKAAYSGLTWKATRQAFDGYQSRSLKPTVTEGLSTQNAEKYGYMLGRYALPYHGKSPAFNFAKLIYSLAPTFLRN